MALELRGTYYPGCTVINSTDNLPNLWHTSIKAAIVDHEDGSRAAEMEVERLGGYSIKLWYFMFVHKALLFDEHLDWFQVNSQNNHLRYSRRYTYQSPQQPHTQDDQVTSQGANSKTIQP